jgi:hypothetical protein
MSELMEESLSTLDPGPKDRLRENLDQGAELPCRDRATHASRLKVLAALDEVGCAVWQRFTADACG